MFLLILPKSRFSSGDPDGGILKMWVLADNTFTRVKADDPYFRTEWEVMRDKFFGVADYQLKQRYGLIEHEVDTEYYKNVPDSLVYVRGEFTTALKKAWDDFRTTQKEGSEEFATIMKGLEKCSK